jgi:hypothetical protein
MHHASASIESISGMENGRTPKRMDGWMIFFGLGPQEAAVRPNNRHPALK